MSFKTVRAVCVTALVLGLAGLQAAASPDQVRQAPIRMSLDDPVLGSHVERMLAQIERAASFVGVYETPEAGFFIDNAPGVRTRAEIEAELTEAASRAALRRQDQGAGAEWALCEEGFVGKGEGGRTILHKLPPEAPEVSWPMGRRMIPATARTPVSCRSWSRAICFWSG